MKQKQDGELSLIEKIVRVILMVISLAVLIIFLRYFLVSNSNLSYLYSSSWFFLLGILPFGISNWIMFRTKYWQEEKTWEKILIIAGCIAAWTITFVFVYAAVSFGSL